MSRFCCQLHTATPTLQRGLHRLIASTFGLWYHCLLPLQLRGDLVGLTQDEDFKKVMGAFGVSLLPGLRARRPLKHDGCKRRWNRKRQQAWLSGLLMRAVQLPGD